MDGEIRSICRKWNIPGSLMPLKPADEPVWIGAVGKSNLEHQTDLRITDPFRTGSITKALVATVSSAELATGWEHNGRLLGVDANWFFFQQKSAVRHSQQQRRWFGQVVCGEIPEISKTDRAC